MKPHAPPVKVLPPPSKKIPWVNLCLIGGAVDEVRNNIKAPEELIFSAALTSISLATQGLITVEKPTGQITPVSIFNITVADSGERKSTVYNIFMEPIREIQKQQDLVYLEKLAEWTARMCAWTARKNKIIKSIGSDEGADGDEEQRLLDHENKKPVKPIRFKMLYEDATPEALFLGLYENILTAGLLSSEGGVIFNGRALADLSKYNSIWGGDSITVDRASVKSASYELDGARLTLSIQIQESEFRAYVEKRGEKARGSGFLARFLVCRPQSTQGERILENCTMSWEYRYKFASRLTEILKENLLLLEDSTRKKQVISFSSEAARKWLEVYNEIEYEIRNGGRFEGMGDYASKLADNISRVAALFHYFENRDGDISLSTLEAAIDLCAWHSDEFREVFVPPPQEKTDAIILIEWLRTWRGGAGREFLKNDIRQNGPNCLRSKNRLNNALEELRLQRKITICYIHKATYVYLRSGR